MDRCRPLVRYSARIERTYGTLKSSNINIELYMNFELLKCIELLSNVLFGVFRQHVSKDNYNQTSPPPKSRSVFVCLQVVGFTSEGPNYCMYLFE